MTHGKVSGTPVFWAVPHLRSWANQDDKNASLPWGFFTELPDRRWVQENLRLRRDLELSRAMLSRQGDPKTIETWWKWTDFLREKWAKNMSKKRHLLQLKQSYQSKKKMDGLVKGWIVLGKGLHFAVVVGK